MKDFPRVILLFLTVDWPIFMRRKMLYGLAQAVNKYDSTVVAVNRPLCPFTTIIRKPDRMREFFDKAPLEKLTGNLYLFSPRYFLHDILAEKYESLRKLNIRMLRKAYSDLSKRIGIEEPNPIVWYHHPRLGYVCRLFERSINIFEIYDNLADHEGRELPDVGRLERKYRQDIDLFLTTSPKLLEKYGKNYEHSLCSGNGLDRETFDKFSVSNIKPDSRIISIPSPRVGYTGVISQRLDWNLIGKLASGMPETNFVFVGPLDKSASADSLKKYTNIHFTGAYPHELMPSVLKSFDIGFMPYKDNDFFRYANPLKFYEFAAAGLRSVSSNMEILNSFDRDFVRIVPNDPGLWKSAITELLSMDKNGAEQVGGNIAKKYLWNNIYAGILEQINEMFFSGE